MNECVKTGLWFIADGRGGAMTGDLFYRNGYWQVRGVPAALFDGPQVPAAILFDAHLPTLNWQKRGELPWYDSDPFPRLAWVSNSFRAHIDEWYQELRDLPEFAAA